MHGRVAGLLGINRSHNKQLGRPKSYLMKRLVIAMFSLIGAGLLAIAATSALAEGTNSIASAPRISFGHLQTGNTATGFEVAGQLWSFWKGPVRAGDTVTIDWEAKRGTNIKVFSTETTDFNFTKAEPVHKGGIGPTGRNEFRFVAANSGLMPLAFEAISTEYGGPYAYTVRVKHWHPHR